MEGVVERTERAASQRGEEESGKERRTNLARAELATVQTIHGITLGLEFCVLIECDEPRVIVGSAIVGGGAGLALTLLPTNEGVRPGRAIAYNSGTAWGAFHGINFTLAGNFERPVGVVMLGQLLGLGAGAAFDYFAGPTSGTVSMMNSGGIYTSVLYGLLGGPLGYEELDDSAYFPLLVVAADVGIAGAAILSEFYPMSRGRTLVIDSGALLGGLLGLGLPLLINPDTEGNFLRASTSVGLIAGVGLAGVLTRGWDDADGLLGLNGLDNLQFSAAPRREGGMQLNLSAQF